MKSIKTTYVFLMVALKLTLDILELQMKNKKKRSWVFFWSNLFEGGYGFLNFFKGGHLQKSLGNPSLDI